LFFLCISYQLSIYLVKCSVLPCKLQHKSCPCTNTLLDSNWLDGEYPPLSILQSNWAFRYHANLHTRDSQYLCGSKPQFFLRWRRWNGRQSSCNLSSRCHSECADDPRDRQIGNSHQLCSRPPDRSTSPGLWSASLGSSPENYFALYDLAILQQMKYKFLYPFQDKNFTDSLYTYKILSNRINIRPLTMQQCSHSTQQSGPVVISGNCAIIMVVLISTNTFSPSMLLSHGIILS